MIKIIIFPALLTFSFFLSLKLFAAEEAELLLKIEKQINISLEDKIQLSIEKEQLEVQIKETQEKIKFKKTLITKRLKSLYYLKQFKWGELLLNKNLNELERNLKILKNINKYDFDLFREYNSSFKQLALARKNLQETESMIQKNIETLRAQQDEFYQLEESRILYLKREMKESLLMFKGHLARPLEGSLKQAYGTLKDQQNQFYLINRGELYAAKPAAFVKAVGPGVVIFRDELTRWRETLIIQHEDNYYSVYAGVKNLKKSVGEKVEMNEQLGSIADENLYFELRHFDNPINPKTWYRE